MIGIGPKRASTRVLKCDSFSEKGGKQSPSSGFTLLELTLALGIFVLAAGLLSRLLLIGRENVESAQWRSQAWLIAEARFAELEGGYLTLDDQGTTAMSTEFADWQWSFTAAPAGPTALYRIEILISYTGTGPAGRAASLNRRRCRPSAAG